MVPDEKNVTACGSISSRIGATSVAQLGVAALDKGWAIAGKPRPEGRALGVRLDLSHACSPE